MKHGDTLPNRPGEQARVRLQVLHARAGAATVDIAAKSTANEQRVASEAQRDVSRSKLNEISEKTSKTCFSDKAAGIIEAEMNEVCVRTESRACLEVSKEHVDDAIFYRGMGRVAESSVLAICCCRKQDSCVGFSLIFLSQNDNSRAPSKLAQAPEECIL